MTVTQRWGITIPLAGVPLMEHKEWLVELEDLGFTDVWSAETNGTDAFTPLVLAAVWAPTLRLGQAIVPVYTRVAFQCQPYSQVEDVKARQEAMLDRIMAMPRIAERWDDADVEAVLRAELNTFDAATASH